MPHPSAGGGGICIIIYLGSNRPCNDEAALATGQPIDEYGTDEIIRHRILLLDSLNASLPSFVGPAPITDVLDYSTMQNLLTSNNLPQAIEQLELLRSFIASNMVVATQIEQSTKDNILFLIDNFINSLRKQI